MANSGDAIYGGLLARGFTAPQAAALAGNFQQESSFDPSAWNASSGAGGLAQWRQDRLSSLFKYAKDTGRDPSDPNAQMDFVVHEMQGPEAASSADFLKATDVSSANAALKKYLRYGPTESGHRLDYSQAFATQPTHKAGPAMPTSPTDLLSKYLGGDDPSQAATVTPTASPSTSANDNATLLEKYLGSASPDASGKGPTPAELGWKPGLPITPEIKAAFLAHADDPVTAVVKATMFPSTHGAVDQVSAGFTSALDAIPIAGPTILKGMEAFRGAVHGMTPEQVAAETNANEAANPVAAGVGTVAGTVLPLLALPGSALLGTSAKASLPLVGNLGARMLAGAVSGAAIEGADSVARGGSMNDAGHNALLAGGIAGAFPLAGKLVRGAFRAIKGPSAAESLGNALTADQIAPENVNRLLGRLGNDATVADLGPNVQQLAGSLASLPGEAKTTVMNNLLTRAVGAGDRLTADVAKNLGVSRPINAEIASLTAKQSAAATPLYNAVRDVPVQVTPSLDFVSKTPLGKYAFGQAAEMAANDGYKPGGMTVGIVDYAKRALDDIAETAKRTGNNNAARQAAQMADALKKETDAQVPLYASARDAYAGPAKVKDAIETGRAVFTRGTTPEDLKAELAGMSTSERDGLLLGAQAAVQDIIGNAKNDAQAVKSAFASSFSKDKLALLIGPDAADAIEKAIDREAAFVSTKHVATGNSLTAARTAGQKAVSPETVGLPSTKSATWTGLFLAAIEKARNALTSTYRADQNIKLANMLTQAGGVDPALLGKVAAAVAPRNASLAPAAAPLLAQDVPTNAANSNMLLPRKPLQMAVSAGRPIGAF